MKKMTIKRVVISAILITGISGMFALSSASQAEPGSDQDPVVTLSYVEKRIQEVLNTLNARITTLENKGIGVSTEVKETEPVQSNSPDATQATYEVVLVEKGKFLYCGASTELILRGGKATAIASVNGGLADLTVGRDIQSGEIIPDNHLLLIPRDDGRGIAVNEDAWVMIKGKYSIVE